MHDGRTPKSLTTWAGGSLAADKSEAWKMHRNKGDLQYCKLARLQPEDRPQGEDKHEAGESSDIAAGEDQHAVPTTHCMTRSRFVVSLALKMEGGIHFAHVQT